MRTYRNSTKFVNNFQECKNALNLIMTEYGEQQTSQQKELMERLDDI